MVYVCTIAFTISITYFIAFTNNLPHSGIFFLILIFILAIFYIFILPSSETLETVYS